MPIKVVHVRRGCRYTQYIGRAGNGFSQSIFHNPFHIGKDGSRAEVIAKFAEYWYAPEQWDLRRAAWYLAEDAVLGCWCKPELCHGDIIAGYLEWRWGKQQCL